MLSGTPLPTARSLPGFGGAAPCQLRVGGGPGLCAPPGRPGLCSTSSTETMGQLGGIHPWQLARSTFSKWTPSSRLPRAPAHSPAARFSWRAGYPICPWLRVQIQSDAHCWDPRKFQNSARGAGTPPGPLPARAPSTSLQVLLSPGSGGASWEPTVTWVSYLPLLSPEKWPLVAFLESDGVSNSSASLLVFSSH